MDQIDPHTLSGDALKELFDAHVLRGNVLPPQPADQMLIAYAYFKQAQEGDNTADRPVHSDVIRTFKHDSWDRLKGMSQEEAMRKYILHIRTLIQQEREGI
jgi:diazepam-binding inhibitor (GABA receptor modulating acyl-CoA-binding protein)